MRSWHSVSTHDALALAVTVTVTVLMPLSVAVDGIKCLQCASFLDTACQSGQVPATECHPANKYCIKYIGILKKGQSASRQCPAVFRDFQHGIHNKANTQYVHLLTTCTNVLDTALLGPCRTILQLPTAGPQRTVWRKKDFAPTETGQTPLGPNQIIYSVVSVKASGRLRCRCRIKI